MKCPYCDSTEFNLIFDFQYMNREEVDSEISSAYHHADDSRFECRNCLKIIELGELEEEDELEEELLTQDENEDY